MEQSLERRGHVHSRKMPISLSISFPGTGFFHWRVKSWHRISWLGFCLYPTPLKPFLSLAALALLPLLPLLGQASPRPCSTRAGPSTWGCTRSLCSSSWAPPQTPELSSLVRSSEKVHPFYPNSAFALLFDMSTSLLVPDLKAWLSPITCSFPPEEAHFICVDPSTAKLPTFIQLLWHIQKHLPCY